MEFPDKTRNYKQLNLEDEYKGFEGSESDMISERHIKIKAYQLDLTKRNSTVSPALRICIRDTIQNNITLIYQYFFDGDGQFIDGFCQQYGEDSKKYMKHKNIDDLEKLNKLGKSIENILKNQDIPESLLDFEIIKSLRDNTVKTNVLKKQYL